MIAIALVLAASLHVDPEAGNNTFTATFDAPLGERINATSSSVGCMVRADEKTGAVSGSCSVPLTSVMVDNEPTKTEHFQQWVTNKKSDPKKCRIEAKFEGVNVVPGAEFSADALFTFCGRKRTDGGKEHLTGKAVMLPDGRLRIRARVEKLNRDAYQIGPKYTAGWLSRVQQLAPVVAEEGSVEISIFARKSNGPETASK